MTVCMLMPPPGSAVGKGKSSPLPTVRNALTRPSKEKVQPSFSTSVTSAAALRLQNTETATPSPRHAPFDLSLFRMFTRSPRENFDLSHKKPSQVEARYQWKVAPVLMK